MQENKANVPQLKEIAQKRIDILLQKAQEAAAEREEDSIYYVKLAQKLAKRHQIPLGKERKMKFCKKCFRPWIEGRGMKIIDDKKKRRLEYACICGAKRVFLYSKGLKDSKTQPV